MTQAETIPAESLAEAPSSARRWLWPWLAVDVLGCYASTMFCAAVYWYAARRLQAPPATRFWLSASWGWAYVFIALLGGKLADRWGARPTAIRLLALAIVTPLLAVPLIREFGLWGVAVAMLLFNCTSSSVWPALESGLSRSPSRMPLDQRVTLYNLGWALASFVAFFTVGGLFDLHPLLPFVLTAAVALAALVILRQWGPAASMIAATTHVESHPPAQKRREPGDPHARRLLYMAWLGNALSYMALQTLIPVIPTLSKQIGIISAGSGAAVAALWPLARLVSFVALGKTYRWHYSVRYLLGSMVLLVLSFFVMMEVCTAIPHGHGLQWRPATVLAVFLAAQATLGFAAAFVYASSLYYAMHVGRGGGGHAALHEAILGIGIALGPTIAALAATGNNGMQRSTLAVTAVLILGVLAMAVMGLTVPRQHQAPAPIEA